MAIFGIMGMVSEALTSCAGDYLKGNLMVVNLVAATVLIVNNIVAAYSTFLTAIFVYGAVSGFSVGCMVYFSVNYEIMDGENVDTLFMTMRFSKGIGAAVGPYLAGHVRDVSGSYFTVFLAIASCFGVFALGTGVLIFINKRRNLHGLELLKSGHTMLE
ncbi:monocarboxylate transporter 13-like [Lingula anatina]|uniref:Monocarboxylate transporter 13-like n=1 Tax=Lingula anatina TaxID=7574 RepID=A0A1S3I3Y1_LINAN|nr:monocarboxylate transporter 13-like [Lingula anatina]|eukprot:XP_013392541.1 monocarboxylate transporter 13-like [Lingula anatina]